MHQPDLTSRNTSAKDGSTQGHCGRENVIILTSGLTGSSVLTGFLARSGYWAGDVTSKKEYDTYENSELVRLNSMLLKEAGFQGNYTTGFSQKLIDRVAGLSTAIDTSAYRRFVEQCDGHRPWVWKDPRLCFTIGFWADILPLESCRFLVLTRDLWRAWIAGTLRRRIASYRWHKWYEQSISSAMVSFLQARNLDYAHVTYEGLIAQPDQTINKMNSFLAANLDIQDLAAIYTGPLHKRPKSSTSGMIKAVLLYLKNYPERLHRIEA